MAKIACPYCYTGFAERQIEFRCAGHPGPHGTPCPSKRDDVLVRHTGRATPVPPAFKANGRQLRATCPGCRGETTYRICPYCHSHLPVHFGKVDSRLIAMIGAKQSGKTVFMTVLVHELMNEVGRRFDAAVVGSDDETRKRFARDYEHRLYAEKALFDTTKTAATRGGRVEPLVFRLTLRQQRRLAQAREQHTILSFFDTAGEDLVSQQSVDLNVRYLTSADGIILLLDPLQMRGARAQARPGTVLPAGAGAGFDTPVNVLSRVTDLLRSQQTRRPSEKISTPLAVTFSKIDALDHTFSPGSPLTRDAPEVRHFDTRDSLVVHAEIQALLHDWHGSQIDQILQHDYATFRYFGLSALGDIPASPNQVSDVPKPYRVQDPFLWLLSEFGTIPATKV